MREGGVFKGTVVLVLVIISVFFQDMLLLGPKESILQTTLRIARDHDVSNSCGK